MATVTDPQDKALHAQAEQYKRDLKAGAHVKVPTGDEAAPGERPDPFAARKAMFQQADALRDAQAAQGGTIQDAALAQAAKDAGVDLDALRRGHTDVGANEAPAEPVVDRTLHLNKTKTEQAASTDASQSADARVTVTVNGAQIEVAKRDVDRAGGAALYARTRELEAERERLALQSATLQQELEAARKLREELQQAATSSAGQGDDPANRAADPAAQRRNDAGNTGVDRQQLRKRIAAQIYSGDQDEAEKGIDELIRLVDERTKQARTETVVTPVAEGSQQTKPPINPHVELVNKAINAMSLAEFPDLMKNQAGKAAAYQRFLELVKAPENANRLAVDVARDACEEMEAKFVNTRAAVVERKRGLQNPSAASGALRDEGDTVAQDASSIVEQMAQARPGQRLVQRK